jgi:YVTN family beta-propeller protein
MLLRIIGIWAAAALTILLADGFILGAPGANAATLLTPSHSTTIALTSDDRHVVVFNREANSLSIIRVRNAQGRDVGVKLDEIVVGLEPRCVAVHPDNQEAYVTNGIGGTVSVASPNRFRVLATIPVGTEPRGLTLTPNGLLLYVANHTAGTVSIISTSARTVVGTVPAGRNPAAIAVTNDGDADDLDERVFVTDFFAEPRTGVPPERVEGFDDGKQGVVYTFPVAYPNAITKITLSPLANVGFTANGTSLCPQLNPLIHPPHLTNPTFCPDPNAAAGNPVITQGPQVAFPNQFLSALLRCNRLWVPDIGAGPEPPVLTRLMARTVDRRS